MDTTLQKAIAEYDTRTEPATEIQIEGALENYIRTLETREQAQRRLLEAEEKESEAIAAIIRLTGPRAFSIRGTLYHACCSKLGRLYFRENQKKKRNTRKGKKK